MIASLADLLDAIIVGHMVEKIFEKRDMKLVLSVQTINANILRQSNCIKISDFHMYF